MRSYKQQDVPLIAYQEYCEDLQARQHVPHDYDVWYRTEWRQLKWDMAHPTLALLKQAEAGASWGCATSLPFQPYCGNYDKRYYDVLTEDGAVHLQVWPNAGKFRGWHGHNLVSLDTADGTAFEVRPVYIRPSILHPTRMYLGWKAMSLAAYVAACNDVEAFAESMRPVVDARDEERKRLEALVGEEPSYPSVEYVIHPSNVKPDDPDWHKYQTQPEDITLSVRRAITPHARIKRKTKRQAQKLARMRNKRRK